LNALLNRSDRRRWDYRATLNVCDCAGFRTPAMTIVCAR
jgi:hypothetical protein